MDREAIAVLAANYKSIAVQVQFNAQKKVISVYERATGRTREERKPVVVRNAQFRPHDGDQGVVLGEELYECPAEEVDSSMFLQVRWEDRSPKPPVFCVANGEIVTDTELLVIAPVTGQIRAKV